MYLLVCIKNCSDTAFFVTQKSKEIAFAFPIDYNHLLCLWDSIAKQDHWIIIRMAYERKRGCRRK